MSIPVIYAPQTLDFGGVRLGSFGPDISEAIPFSDLPNFEGSIEIKEAPVDANVITYISGDTERFSIRDVYVLEWELEPVDTGELPPGFHGPVPKVRQLEVVTKSDGTGALFVAAGQVLLVRIAYAAQNVDGSYGATLVIQGDTWDTVEVPLSLFISDIATTFDASPVQIVQGQQVTVPMIVTSIAGPAADPSYEASVLLVDTGISITPTIVHVEPQQSIAASLTLTADVTAPLGANTIFVDQLCFNHRRGMFLMVNVLPQPQVDVELEEATREIAQFYADSKAILIVGSPAGLVERNDDGSFQQQFTFGTIVKPLNSPPQIGERVHVDIEIAAVRCFGTDDPSGTDEPYLIATVYKIDPSEGQNAVQTVNVGPDDIGSVTSPAVFAEARLLANNVTVPGDGEIRLHVQVWDQELLGNYNDVKNKTSDAAHDAIAAGLSALDAQVGGASAIVSKLGGLLDSVSSAIGGIIADLLADDLIAEHDFTISADFLKALVESPDSLERTSGSIPGIGFNYPALPQFPENDSDAGRSWLFDGGDGGGTYRVFFRVKQV